MGSVTINIINGTPEYDVSIQPGDVNIHFASGGIKVINDLPNGEYTITLSDNNGCIDEAYFSITTTTTSSTTIPLTTTTTSSTSTTSSSTTTTTTTQAPTTTTTTTQGVEQINYGALYNWYAATNDNNITSSDDWVVPTFTQETTLRTYAGGNISGTALKEIGTTYWGVGNTGTNVYGFNSRGSGSRANAFGGITINGDYWSSTQVNATNGYSIRHAYNSENTTNASSAKYYGYSIRLLYVGTGAPTEYTGNDGRVYRIVTIGTQTWLADNLNETKYRNGNWITGYDGGIYTPITNSAWAALTTEAMCYYDDDENNG